MSSAIIESSEWSLPEDNTIDFSVPNPTELETFNNELQRGQKAMLELKKNQDQTKVDRDLARKVSLEILKENKKLANANANVAQLKKNQSTDSEDENGYFDTNVAQDAEEQENDSDVELETVLLKSLTER